MKTSPLPPLKPHEKTIFVDYLKHQGLNRKRVADNIAVWFGKKPHTILGEINNWTDGRLPLPRYVACGIEGVLGLSIIHMLRPNEWTP